VKVKFVVEWEYDNIEQDRITIRQTGSKAYLECPSCGKTFDGLSGLVNVLLSHLDLPGERVIKWGH
jgi:hypothetical protein